VLPVVPLPGPAIASVFNRTRPLASRQCVAAETASELEPPGPDIPDGFGEPPGGLVCAAAARTPAVTKQTVRSILDMTHSIGWSCGCVGADARHGVQRSLVRGVPDLLWHCWRWRSDFGQPAACTLRVLGTSERKRRPRAQDQRRAALAWHQRSQPPRRGGSGINGGSDPDDLSAAIKRCSELVGNRT
jgi:hypothetical protein